MMIPASFRFTDNGDGTITDNLTGLMWLKDTNCMETHYAGTWPLGYANWQDAQDIITGINDGTYANCGAGYTDWRLPNRKELHSLADFSQSGPALPVGHPFDNVELGPPGFYYLTSTTCADSTGSFWGINIGDGKIVNAQKLSTVNWVWPVRTEVASGATPSASGGGGGCFIETAGQ
jgi:hypothetical protein